jgi:hypothetical protein
METELKPIFILETEDGDLEFDNSSKIIYEEDFIKEKNPQFKEEARLMLNKLGFDLKTQKEIEKSFKDPNQLSLFDQLEQDKQLWEEVKDKWIESGRTEADFNSMNNEEREHTIKNCL